MRLSLFLAGAGIFLSLPSLFARPFQPAPQDTAKAEASLEQATVYFGYGAELTHTGKIRVETGTRYIVLGPLATTVDARSLQISLPEELALMSQRFQVITPPVPPVPPNKEALRWEDSIAAQQKEINRLNYLVTVENEILGKTSLLIETTIKSNGNKEILGADLLKLVEHYTARIDKSRMAIYQYQLLVGAHQDRIRFFQERIRELQPPVPKQARPYGQVILQVMCRTAGEVPVNLSYYTNNAGWTALYDVRVNSKTNKVKLVYKASLTQTTGIDWRKTKLTLSTGTPNFGVTAPVLSPWYLQLYVPGIYTNLQRRALQGNAQRNVIQSFEDEKQLAEVVTKDDAGQYRVKSALPTVDPSTVQQYTTLNEGQLNNNYEIDLPYDIDSDGQLHSVTIKEQLMNCNLKNYAVPRVDGQAYLLAEVADWQNLDLLPGESNIIMDDTYIGKSSIDPNSIADTLNLSLGRDRRLVVKRSPVKELTSLKTSGKEAKQVFTYEITVKNNKVTDVNLLLKDQFPLSNIKEVEVKLDDDGGAMVNPETGVLTWKLELKPGESRKVRFTYTVRYPKDQRIVNLK